MILLMKIYHLTFTFKFFQSCSWFPLLLDVTWFTFITGRSLSVVLTSTLIFASNGCWTTIISKSITHTTATNRDIFDGVVVLRKEMKVHIFLLTPQKQLFIKFTGKKKLFPIRNIHKQLSHKFKPSWSCDHHYCMTRAQLGIFGLLNFLLLYYFLFLAKIFYN